MSELRWNPLLGTYTMVAGNRQNRPHLPKDHCPFCPGSGKVPDAFDIFVYDNDFPTLSLQPDDVSENDFFLKKEAYGKCEVILYSSNHHTSLYQLPLGQIEKLIRIWKQRTEALSADPKIKYIFPFENRGEEVGVTIHHPHGQLYAYSWIPAKIYTELLNCRDYFQKNECNFFDDFISQEKKSGLRIIEENDSFITLIPFFTDYPYGAFIVAKNDLALLSDFSDKEISDLAMALKNITGAFEMLFEKIFPYMMCVHQLPVNHENFQDAKKYFRFHIEFYPPLRAADKLKWMASSETGAGAAANPLLVEETAVELRNALNKFISQEP